MKLKNIIFGMTAGVLLLSLNSCEDFLNRPKEDGYNTGLFYKTDEQCLQGVNYLYNAPWYDFQRAFIKVGEMMSGNLYAGGSDKQFVDLTVNGTQEEIINMSYSLWSVNAHANTVILNILSSEGPSQAIKNQCIGECLTWKAMAYFYLARIYGDVPIIHDNTSMIKDGTYNLVYKVKKEHVYEYICLTLEKAMELLPKRTGNYNGRIDYYAAEALLAKVYLTKAGVMGSLNTNDLKAAAEYAKDVIDNSGRKLLDNYQDVFKLENNINEEALISWAWDCGTDIWTSQNSFQSDFGMNGFSELADSWGDWTGPSVALMDAFGVSPADDPKVRENEKDSRRAGTLMMMGDFYERFWKDKGGFDYAEFHYDKEYAPQGPTEYRSPTGAHIAKHLYGNIEDHKSGCGISPKTQSSELATHLLRLSDLYLVYAEAKLLGENDAAEALKYVNKVRERAGVDPLASVTFDDIWKERRLELALEGDRWYDYVRLSYYDINKAMTDLDAQRKREYYGLGDLYKEWYESGRTEWNLDETITRYNTDEAKPNVTPSCFVLPFPNEDLVYNPRLTEPAIDVDVRATYSYNF